MRPAWWNLYRGRDGSDPPEPPDDDAPKERPVNGVHGLADLARGMQHVAQSAADISGQAFINVLNHYIDPATGQPIEKRLTLPSGQVLDVPLFAIVPPSTLILKQLKIRMSVEVHDVAVKRHQYDDNMPEVDRTSFKVSFAPSDADNVRRKGGSGKMMDMEMVFESEDPPEALRRLQEMFTDMMTPQDPDEADKYGLPKRPLDDDAGPESIPAPAHDAPARAWDDEPKTTDPSLEDTQEIKPPDDTVSSDND